MIKQKKKNITLDNLAGMITRGFNEVYDRMGKGFNEVNQRIDMLEKSNLLGHEEIKSEIRAIKYELQQKASAEELNELDERLTKVEIQIRKFETKV